MADSDASANILKLPDVLDLNAAGAMHEKICQMKGSPIEVDAQDVRKTSAQCIQVLLSAKRTWDNEGHSFVISNMSDAFSNTMKLLGITNEILPTKEMA